MNHSVLSHLIAQNGDHFTPYEFAVSGDQTKLKREIVEPVLQFRAWHGFATLLTSAYRQGDPRSHGQGMAIDQIMFYQWGKTIVDPIHQWNLAQAFGVFKGIGIYFDWEYKGRKAVGLHLDTWNHEDRPARWLRMEVDGQPHYFYQDFKTGLFYNKKLNKSVTLTDAITLYND